MRIRVGNKERANALRWKTSRGKCGECEREDLWVTRNMLKAIPEFAFLASSTWEDTGVLPRLAGHPGLYSMLGYDNREGSWKPGAGGRARGVGGSVGAASRQKLGVPRPKSREAAALGRTILRGWKGGKSPSP